MKLAPLAFAAIAVFAVATQAQAQSARAACRADYSKLCADTSPGGGRIIACLKDHADKLSQGCKDALKSAQAK